MDTRKGPLPWRGRVGVGENAPLEQIGARLKKST
ncbi:hypothetical protein GEOBRER4_n2116 [Citrifermentans bremense]|uniref:Uncharacterized protein n=1 Tax=Citrifermentans bremense TaxID=60035 RepID=A0A7R7FS77_9BACT|nr:hypothetical protein GEOBRER4_n2116 [Citrifermentans bremense]